MTAKIDLIEYQDWVETKWIRSENPTVDELRIHLGIHEEGGEIAGKCKKYHRAVAAGTLPKGGEQKLRVDVAKEMGDILFYLAKLANFYDLDMDTILMLNVEKLEDRADRGVIDGAGDER